MIGDRLLVVVSDVRLEELEELLLDFLFGFLFHWRIEKSSDPCLKLQSLLTIISSIACEN